MRLDGKVALVTGGAAGIGRAVAERLAADGAAVLVADLDDAGAAVAEAMGARFVQADLATDDGVRVALAAGERAGGLDVLVNNAGGTASPHYPTAPAEHWMRILDLNLRSVLLATQLAVEQMAARGGGAVVNVASSAGLGRDAHEAPEYAAAKAGVVRLTSALAPLRERHGVRVNCVCPDIVDTPASRRGRAKMTPEELAALAPVLPPEAVAAEVAALVGDDRLAGRVVLVRGGMATRMLDTAGWLEA